MRDGQAGLGHPPWRGGGCGGVAGLVDASANFCSAWELQCPGQHPRHPQSQPLDIDPYLVKSLNIQPRPSTLTGF